MTDAIASAGGTTINYMDVSNGTDVTSYKNRIIGTELNYMDNAGIGSSVIAYNNGNLYTAIIFSGGTISTYTPASIRVFYY